MGRHCGTFCWAHMVPDQILGGDGTVAGEVEVAEDAIVPSVTVLHSHEELGGTFGEELVDRTLGMDHMIRTFHRKASDVITVEIVLG